MTMPVTGEVLKQRGVELNQRLRHGPTDDHVTDACASAARSSMLLHSWLLPTPEFANFSATLRWCARVLHFRRFGVGKLLICLPRCSSLGTGNAQSS